MIVLIVTIGLLNVCLGFGLAMYFGYGPPGVDGIFEALGPMPPVGPSAELLVSSSIGAPYDPLASPESPAGIGANLPAGNTIAPRSEPLAEEKVLGDIRDLTTTTQATMVRQRS
ncbi:MAG: hypothetical protein ACLP9L_35585 [Thermoguttaceae bacterium]